MRATAFIVCCVVVASIGVALLLTSSPGVLSGDAKQKVQRHSVRPLQSDPTLPLNVQDPTHFPPQHTDRCDFSEYHPTRISDWLPAGVVDRAIPSYPVQARLKGVGGTVNVFVLINREGSVALVCSVGPEELRMAAESAAVLWRFRRPTFNQGTDPFGYIQETLPFKFVP